MKKQIKMQDDKKKRLIILITVIVLIVIIIGSILIRNVVVKQQAKVENYLAGENTNSSLIANNIKKGITIGGITGTLEVLDTSDANATPEDIALGKTAYVNGVKITGTRVEIEKFPETESGTCYYADIDDNGTVDGIIFADLARGNTGDGNWGDNSGDYTIPVESGFKEYYVKEEEVTDDFGTGKVVAPVKGSQGNERFYVMALDDFDANTHYWYKEAYGNLDSQYNVGNTENDFAKAGEEAIGRKNTYRMIARWNVPEYGNQNANDMWGIIQTKEEDGKSKIEKGWFVPSKSEWAAFGGEVLEPLNITSSNYDDYGLSTWCWSSSQYTTSSAYNAFFSLGHISNPNVNFAHYVRLAATF